MSATKSRECPVLIVRPEGQLGNRLFQYATCLAASFELGFPIWNPARADYADFFPALSSDFFCRSNHVSASKFGKHRACFCSALDWLTAPFFLPLWGAFGIQILDISRSYDSQGLEFDLTSSTFKYLLDQGRPIFLKGWKFRAHYSLRTHREKILPLFRIRDDLQSMVSEAMKAPRAAADLVIGVHVRRGDYAGFLGGKYFFDWSDYSRWMQEAVALWPDRNVAFLVCSNEANADWMKETGLSAFYGPGSPVTDLYALASCDFLMGPPSTFTLWASYFGGAPLHMLERADQALNLQNFTHHERV
jgi:hypothetical protein